LFVNIRPVVDEYWAVMGTACWFECVHDAKAGEMCPPWWWASEVRNI